MSREQELQASAQRAHNDPRLRELMEALRDLTGSTSVLILARREDGMITQHLVSDEMGYRMAMMVAEALGATKPGTPIGAAVSARPKGDGHA
jgi:hypothetical protein